MKFRLGCNDLLEAFLEPVWFFRSFYWVQSGSGASGGHVHRDREPEHTKGIHSMLVRCSARLRWWRTRERVL